MFKKNYHQALRHLSVIKYSFQAFPFLLPLVIFDLMFCIQFLSLPLRPKASFSAPVFIWGNQFFLFQHKMSVISQHEGDCTKSYIFYQSPSFPNSFQDRNTISLYGTTFTSPEFLYMATNVWRSCPISCLLHQFPLPTDY